ncbi:MAG: hypothetical protein P1U34_04905 [Coxiellaceae bacterium]|nr:hypothetical protein [Coxiellaceae bacterium]
MRNTGQSKSDIFPVLTDNKPSEPLLAKAKQNPAQLVLDEIQNEELARGCGFTWSILCCLPSFGGSIGCCECDMTPRPNIEDRCCSIWPGCLSLNEETGLKSLKSVLTAIAEDYQAKAIDFENAYTQTDNAVNQYRETIGKHYKKCFVRTDIKLKGIQDQVNSIQNYHTAIEQKQGPVSPN